MTILIKVFTLLFGLGQEVQGSWIGQEQPQVARGRLSTPFQLEELGQAQNATLKPVQKARSRPHSFKGETLSNIQCQNQGERLKVLDVIFY